MWIMLSNSFLSIVALTRPEDPTCLLVRARAAGDITQVFSAAVEQHTPDADYAFRAIIPRETVALVIAEQVRQIVYGNFKGSVMQDDRHDAYMDCWIAMNKFQTKRAMVRKQAKVVGPKLKRAKRYLMDDAAYGLMFPVHAKRS